MIIEQIYDKSLAHASYAVANKGKVLLVDPGRDPKPYLDFAKKHDAEIVAVFETHPHADFASSHLEFQQKHGAKIYINPKVGVSYEYEPLDHNDEVTIGDRKSTRLHSSHVAISYAVFCLKKKNKLKLG